ncbi:MAG: hypothetical protein AAF620_19225 [Bacteroidota bacterium]
MQEPNIQYYRFTNTQDHELILANLKEEITNNPVAKHRIILKAIKTAECHEIQKTIREYFKKEFKNG